METSVPTEIRPAQRLQLTLEDFGALGECLAHCGEVPVYVFGGIPGEEVVVEVVRRRRSYVAARVVEVIKPSPHRVTPPCPYFWPCTGCQWQHIAYSYQLEIKQRAIQKALQEVPDLSDVAVNPTVPSPQPFHYRNHARLTVGPQGAVGFVNRVTREFVRIDQCLLMHSWINETLMKLQGRCAETTQLSVRYGANTGEWLVQPRLKNLQVGLASGQKHYSESVLGKRFRIGSPSFFQVNTEAAERMVQHIAEKLQLSGRELLVDAYAGVGTFAILLSPRAGRVVAIEESASAVEDARSNATGLYKVELLQAKTEEALATFPRRPDAVILDPPRAGCHPTALEALGRLAPLRVVYVSCDPEALARDLTVLVRGPFHIEEVQPFDLFPQTHHVECIVTLSLKGPTPPSDTLVLASASPRRQDLLQALGVPFRTLPSEGQEAPREDGETPEAYASRLALQKAQQVAARIGQGLVLGADTVVVLDDQVLGKPHSPQEAQDMLKALAGRTHRVITAVAVGNAATGGWRMAHQVTQVTMRPYTVQEMDAYIGAGGPFDKAGGYAVQDPVFRPVERVEGCYLNVVGLPLCTVADLMQQFGLRPRPQPGWEPPGNCPACRAIAASPDPTADGGGQ
ncbi:MAG: septum formation protein Maf [Chloroflexi bacterium]|nr:septum formation protein Maf [Chloroflexota bacterium]